MILKLTKYYERNNYLTNSFDLQRRELSLINKPFQSTPMVRKERREKKKNPAEMFCCRWRMPSATPLIVVFQLYNFWIYFILKGCSFANLFNGFVMVYFDQFVFDLCVGVNIETCCRFLLPAVYQLLVAWVGFSVSVI